MMLRYQHAPRHVRWYRWLRWKPWYSLKALVQIVRWLAGGAEVPRDWLEIREGFSFCETRGEYLRWIWRAHQGVANCAMRHVWSFEELIRRAELRARLG